MNEAQKTLYYIAENMKMQGTISKEGYAHFQLAIKALDEQSKIFSKIIEGIERKQRRLLEEYNSTTDSDRYCIAARISELGELKSSIIDLSKAPTLLETDKEE